MQLRKLISQSLSDALMGMEIGETCLAPDGLTKSHVRRTCTELKERGYLFTTRTTDGTQSVTRLK